MGAIQELSVLSLFAAYCAGFAWAHDYAFFTVVFAGASAMALVMAIKRAR
jgi:hypothetical protein